MLILKNIKFYSFSRGAEGVDPYINEVCANIVRSIVGRGFTPAVFGNTLAKSLALGGSLPIRWGDVCEADRGGGTHVWRR